ncbi:hypothetical protein L596_000005 [Steinernema carpocapsae]|uniref:Uncharacterized protein n=1 Tax=Steinernema carpocapsae TaxID=34508 RepID=A0A4U8UGF1_STECR|nr:hypothetical protein L596_000005 [Steinernema carpocapsae]
MNLSSRNFSSTERIFIFLVANDRSPGDASNEPKISKIRSVDAEIKRLLCFFSSLQLYQSDQTVSILF